MGSSPPSPSPQWLLLPAAIILSLAARGNSFQTNSYQPCRITSTPQTSTSSTTRVKMSSSSFQRARLAEQLRLSKKETLKEEILSDMTFREESSASATAANSGDGDDNATPSSLDAREEACNIQELDNETLLDHDGMLLAPVMTYEKYLTMPENQVTVAIRYSAEAGLRPFYLTVANQIKSAYPDVILEKRILPPVGSDTGGQEGVFEVVVDGKTVIGKKNTKLLKVTSRSSQKGGDDDKGDDGKSDKGKRNAKSGNGVSAQNAPDIAGGRSIFVSMEKLDQELSKAQKRRRPTVMYKSKEIATGTGGMMAGRADVVERSQRGDVSLNVVGQSPGMTEAVIRLERLKAMSTRNKI